MTNPLAELANLLRQMGTQHGTAFHLIGLHLYESFAVIVVVWAGLKAALSVASGVGRFDFSRFVSMMMTLSFGYAMIRYYYVKLPGLAHTFPELIIAGADDLARIIGDKPIKDLFSTGQSALGRAIAAPVSMLDVGGWLTTMMGVCAMVFMNAAVVGIIGYALIAQGVLVLFGPVFVAFFIVPHLDFLFWGWFRCLLSYSLMVPIAYAWSAIVATIWIHAVVALGVVGVAGSAATMGLMSLASVVMVVFVTVFCVGILSRVPAFTAHLMSGSTGLSAGILELVEGAPGRVMSEARSVAMRF